ncbi:MAG: glutaminase A [Methylovulum sp.]|uniref:glutaminase A n=1 Tax=Methylovulum sp. TaxID=1916980 RepID=UPI00261E534C|nr:glutaminase A [Methylovulum sp.]MDD2722605.1 glutaminase A [Methylovulum sp.]MDD5123797.1 glutaminase A [Methylovulum sp.]
MNVNYFQNYLETLHQSYANLDKGEVASYIPELLKADPQWFGIALITVDGHVYQVGDSRQPFTIQSISKAITYGIALEDNGVEAVLQKVDVEPSGEAFNSISLEPDTGRPRNPMINAGAIATVALINGESADDKLKRMLKCYERYLGRSVTIDEDVYRSEKSTGHRNRAIAYLLRNSDIIEKDTDDVLDVYFKQCSILVTCRDLALIGATLANNGVNPITGVRVLASHYVPKVLSVMSSCGMYDYSGAWVYEVGMPAKSGVGGGIVAVLPGQFGLAVFSPKLDERGNSARGIAACKKISSDFGLHMFRTGRSTTSSVIHASYDAAHVPSKRTRNVEQGRLIAELGHKVMVLELHGELMFTSAEIVIHEAMVAAKKAEYLIIDFTRAAYISEGADSMIAGLIQSLSEHGKTILLTGTWGKYETIKLIKKRIGYTDDMPLLNYDAIDDALEWCEDQLLAGQASYTAAEAPLVAQNFLIEFTAEEMEVFESMLEHRSYDEGAYLCREGDPGDLLYFLLSGQVSVIVPLSHRRSRRITSLSAGSAFGEIAMLDRGKRSADIVADDNVTCLVLDYKQLEEQSSPLAMCIRWKLATNIGRDLARKLRKATLEIKSLRS